MWARATFFAIPTRDLQLLSPLLNGHQALTWEYSRVSLLLAAKDVSPGGTSATQRQKFHTDLVRNSDWSRISYILTNDRQKTKGHKGQMQMGWIYYKAVNIPRIYSSCQKASEFCCSSLAEELKLYHESTRRNIQSNKFTFATPWLPDLLWKHWFTSSVWNFCRWVADVLPGETSLAARSKKKRLYSQANQVLDTLSFASFK